MISVTASITAQNNYTGTIRPVENAFSSAKGHLTISVSGTFVANVILQRSFDAGVSWKTVATYTSATETSISDPTDDVLYRIGVATGGFTSGTVAVILAK